MESTSEVVWKEQTKSSVSKKSVQEVSSTSVQKLSSSSTLIGEQGVLSILGSEGVAIGDASVMSTPSTAENATILSSPLITSPSPQPDEGNAINTSTLQSEFSAMKLKDDQGNEIGEMVQQKQKQESLKVSSSVLTADNGSKTSSSSSVAQVSSSSTSSSSVVQQSATSMLATAEESSSSSVSCSSFSSSKKQEIVSSSTRSLSSIKSSQSIEKVVKSSTTAIVEDHEF